MSDEFATPRQRIEAFPTFADYCESRSLRELASLIWDDTHRSNIFGSYPGTVGQHSMRILEAAAKIQQKTRGARHENIQRQTHAANRNQIDERWPLV